MQSQNFNHVTSCPYLPGTLGECLSIGWGEGEFNGLVSLTGQHLKKASISESSSDMMDLEDGVESTPGLLNDTNRMVPFLGTHSITDKQQQNCCKPSGQNLQQRHNSALAVSIETDV